MKQYLMILLLSSIYWPLSQANAVSAGSLEQYVEKDVLAQWHTLGQRSESVSKVIISGIPQGYKAPKCTTQLEIKPIKTLSLGRNSIQISCQHRSSWSLMLNAEIQVWRNVVVLRDHLSRGEQIRETSLALQQRNIGTLQRGYFTQISDVLNNISKRSLKAGTAVSPSMINLPIIVKRGQAITLRAKRPGFAVDVKGLALKKGRKGDKIKVKNGSSNKVLYGTIVHSDLVLVD